MLIVRPLDSSGCGAIDPHTVVAICGDGDVMMTSQEIATAVHYGIAIIAVIVNNGTYGTIRMHQERDYPGHVIATDITNPDFVLFAQSFGAYGERVEKTEEFGEAFQRARASGKPALIELMAAVLYNKTKKIIKIFFI